MMDQREELELYLEQVTPVFREIFGVAHSITNHYDSAEYVVQRAIQRGFVSRMSRRITFRDHLKQLTVRLAADYVKQNGRPADTEGTWSGFDTVNVQENPFLQEAVSEPLMMRRILMMKFGAGLHSYEIAPLVGLDKARVRGYLQQFEARVERRNRKKGSSYDKLAKYAALQELNRIDADVPDATATFRQLQADMIDPVRPVREGRLRKLIGMLFMGIAILLCVALFWLFAVLMDSDPAPIPANSPAATEASLE